MAVIKEANKDKKKKKKKVERIMMTKRTLEMIMKVCCRSDARKVFRRGLERPAGRRGQ